MRYWPAERVGVDFALAWIRGAQYGPTYSSSTFLFMPSVLVLLTKQDPNADVDIRPFVGGGISYVRGGVIAAPTSTFQTSLVRGGGTGMQTFGGVEMSFKEMDSITISAEVTYYRLPIHILTANVIDGVNYFIVFHFYLK